MTFDEIKAKYNVYDVATGLLGLQLRPSGDGEYRGVSIAPGPHSTDDALSVSATEWHDFSAKIGGSVLDLVAWVKFGNNDGEALKRAAEFLTGETCNSHYSSQYVDERDTFRANVDKWHEALLADDKTLDYLHSRRINDETIKRFKLGRARLYNGAEGKEWRLVCPYFDRYGQPIYYISRQLDWEKSEGSEKYLKAGTKNSAFFRNSLFGLDTIPHKDKDCDTLILPEGLFDALSFTQEGYSLLSPITGHAGKKNVPVVLKEAKRFRRVVTAFDIDENKSGQRFTISWGHKFLAERINFSCIESYGEGKDVSDYYAAGGDLAELINRHTVNGYVFMSRYSFWDSSPVKLSEYVPFANLSPNEKAKSLGEVKKFLYILKTFLPECGNSDLLGGDMQRVIEALCEYFPQDKIAKFAEGPTAQEILCSRRDAFLKDRKLFFHGTVKGGEYWQYDNNNGYWYSMTDADLQAELSEFFNHELTNKDIAQLSMMIRLMVTKQVMPEFNKKRVQVFTNGTLELDTGILCEHRPDDFMTWAHTFAYNEKATCPTYDAFLEQVAVNEQSRIDFLDDLAAYAFYEDCRLEKIFILIGDGMNGKGVYLKTLEALFSSSNARDHSQSVTNIQPCEFDKATERIALAGSMLNISHDINANLKGNSSYLKSIASGDTITGNFKFCDSRSFAPRTKILCSSNHMIKVDDDSYGMRRKLMFCKFAACFKGRADTGLLGKLKAELPGIFNRVYRAYQALLEREKTEGNNAIRASIDQNAYISEFTEIANPVAAFWAEYGDEYLERHEVPKAEIFETFKVFCVRNSLPTGYENTFHGSLQNWLKEKDIQVVITRHRETRRQVYYYVFPNTQNPCSEQEDLDRDADAEKQAREHERELFRIEAQLQRGIEWWRIGYMSLDDPNEEWCVYSNYTTAEVQELLKLNQYDIHDIGEALDRLCREYKASSSIIEGQTMYSLPHIKER